MPLLDTLLKVFFPLLGCILRTIRDFILFIWLLTLRFTIGNKVDINFLKFRFNAILFCVPTFILIYWNKNSKNFLLWIWVYVEWLCIFACYFLFITKYETWCISNVFLMTFKRLRRQLSSNIDEACLCMPNKMKFWWLLSSYVGN